ncbi:MAG TPA: IS3 family transposase, partial [Candidatus Deferrimicrobium sp.]|nr:IS3 family transposase [Candidatus Deferrimicrobium sp.]
MKYAALAKQEYPVQRLCRVLGVSRSGYYAWRSRPASARRCANEELVELMRQIHGAVKQTYGSPRMQEELAACGYRCGHNRVAALMRQHGLVAKMTVRFRRTAKAGLREQVAPNRLERQFVVPVPNRVWAADITYIPTQAGFVYLAVVIDLFSRRVVGWAMHDRLSARLVADALSQAYHHRRPAPGLLHHSDQDGLYSSLVYQHLLTEWDMTASMSRKGNCHDNACVESFFSPVDFEQLTH